MAESRRNSTWGVKKEFDLVTGRYFDIAKPLVANHSSWTLIDDLLAWTKSGDKNMARVLRTKARNGLVTMLYSRPIRIVLRKRSGGRVDPRPVYLDVGGEIYLDGGQCGWRPKLDLIVRLRKYELRDFN